MPMRLLNHLRCRLNIDGAMNGNLTYRFVEAFQLAFSLHRNQWRKGTTIPYISHLLSVSALILENGGDEDQAIAGLLHDAVEDQGGSQTLAEIRVRFGDRVANIVAACSDSFENPKPAWIKRKTAYLEHLPRQPEDVLLVSLADKVHNCRCILADLGVEGDKVWRRFEGGKDGTLWYYRSLADVFRGACPSPLAEELERVVSAIESSG